jgi:hypothetical protein
LIFRALDLPGDNSERIPINPADVYLNRGPSIGPERPQPLLIQDQPIVAA